MAKFFCSGKYEDRFHIKKIQETLRNMGFEIAEDWTNHEYTDKGYPTDYAIDDIEGAIQCDIYVGRFIADYNYKGALVEMGVCLGLGKRCCIIGNAIDSCIFVWHPLVCRFKNEEEFFEYIKGMSE